MEPRAWTYCCFGWFSGVVFGLGAVARPPPAHAGTALLWDRTTRCVTGQRMPSRRVRGSSPPLRSGSWFRVLREVDTVAPGCGRVWTDLTGLWRLGLSAQHHAFAAGISPLSPRIRLLFAQARSPPNLPVSSWDATQPEPELGGSGAGRDGGWRTVVGRGEHPLLGPLTPRLVDAGWGRGRAGGRAVQLCSLSTQVLHRRRQAGLGWRGHKAFKYRPGAPFCILGARGDSQLGLVRSPRGVEVGVPAGNRCPMSLRRGLVSVVFAGGRAEAGFVQPTLGTA